MNLAAALLMEATGRPWLVSPQVSLPAFVVTILLVGSLGPFEEFGWRGFALPLLQRRAPGWLAALLLGFIWALWNVPGFFVASVMSGSMSGEIGAVLLRFFLGTMATATIMTVLYNAVDGSVPLMFLFHWLLNLPYPWEPGRGINLMQDLIGVLVAVGLALLFRRRYLQGENLYTEVAPGIDFAPRGIRYGGELSRP